MICDITISPFPPSFVFDDVDPAVLASEDEAFTWGQTQTPARGDAWRRYVQRLLRPVSDVSHAPVGEQNGAQLASGD